MRSQKQIAASRANGARSRGPVTEPGKRNSARNSVRHGLLAETVVLEAESEERFLDLVNEYMDEFQPSTPTQVALVETMAVARWRQWRVWEAQKTAMDRDMAMQPAAMPPVERVLFAFRASSEGSCPHELLLRYEIFFDRQFSRALKNLLALRKTEPRAQQTAPETEPRAQQADIPPAKRTQQPVENTPPPPPLPSRDSNGAESPSPKRVDRPVQRCYPLRSEEDVNLGGGV